MPFYNCQGCSECGTTLEPGRGLWKKVQPCYPQPRYDTHTGEISYYACQQCGEPLNADGTELAVS